ncbi:O-acetylhomoserine aminocarboxypropyltransferase/cysteine synthase family protein [Clostridium sp. WILCCON 0269]|uniref:O-acetylhomoserine aminocarboxypropyltransferase/cysteine synthase family protein n=1 Tax=Candidatus Clostridium eludens TaxID=3381663 RepID=A0ABW8SGN3_9CLOT
MTTKKFKFDTLQIHAGQKVDLQTGATAVPIYQTSAFRFDTFKDAKAVSSYEKFGYNYTRFRNPTQSALEERIASLEGGSAALAVSSGMAAISYSILNILSQGDEIVASDTLYGGTHSTFTNLFSNMGIKTNFVDPNSIDNFKNHINEKTKAIYVESMGNPGINIVDIEPLSKLAHDNGIPLIIDNTFATPYLFNPIKYGANIVVHSATKFIGGHGSTIGGVIVEGGNFDWAKSGKFPCLTETNYNGIKYYETYKNTAFISKARDQLMGSLGATLSPFNAFMLLQGIETLSLRMKKHVYNAQKVAEFLNKNDKVSWVNYPGLKNSKYHDLGKKYFSKGAGSILTFGLKGGLSNIEKFIDNLQLFSLVTNIGDVKSLVVHPATTTHAELSEEEQALAGVTPDLIRLSIGIEDIDDIIFDLDTSLRRLN